MDIVIARLTENEIDAFVSLVREVFDDFVAPGYSPQGVATFHSYVTRDAVLERFKKGNPMYVAKSGSQIVGAHEIRDWNHISLFFVKKELHGSGIGRKLFERALDEIKKTYPEIRLVSVNASPFAEEIYQALGFVKTADLQERDGIRFIPMEYAIRDM